MYALVTVACSWCDGYHWRNQDGTETHIPLNGRGVYRFQIQLPPQTRVEDCACPRCGTYYLKEVSP